MSPRGESAQLSDVLGQLDELMVLSNNASDDTPLLSTSDGAVTEASSAANDTVVADDVLLRLNDDWAFVPDERLFQHFEDLLIKHGRFDTRDLPLMLSNQQGRHGILDTHDQVEELFKGLERERLACPAEGVSANRVRVTGATRRRDQPLAVGTEDRELVSSQDTLAVVALGPHALRTSAPVGEVAGDFLFNKGQIRLNLSSRAVVVRSKFHVFSLPFCC